METAEHRYIYGSSGRRFIEDSDTGLVYAVPEIFEQDSIYVPIDKETFDALYAMWRCGAGLTQLAEAYNMSPPTLGWLLVMQVEDRLCRYDVHYGVTNKKIG
jgi:hypothetical protein